jgi:hypothetical protein
MTLDTPWQSFGPGTEADLEKFLADASLDPPIQVSLGGNHWSPEAGRILASHPELNIQVLFLRGTLIRDEGIEALISSPMMASVKLLSMEQCGITNRGVCALARSPYTGNLEELYLCNRWGIESGSPNEVGDSGAKALAETPNLSGLTEIDLWNTGVGDEGVEALVTSPYLTRLSTLTVWETRLTDAGTKRIKALAFERWKRREAEGETFPPLCWLHTDYDERIIEY